MTKEETAKLLGWIKKKRPHLFEGLESESASILDRWSKALEEYQSQELNELTASGYYIAYYGYTDKVLTDLLKALDEQRYEHTPEGIAEKERLLAEFYSRHPHRREQNVQ